MIFVCSVSCLTQDSVGAMVEYRTRPSDEKCCTRAWLLVQPGLRLFFVCFELW